MAAQAQPRSVLLSAGNACMCAGRPGTQGGQPSRHPRRRRCCSAGGALSSTAPAAIAPTRHRWLAAASRHNECGAYYRGARARDGCGERRQLPVGGRRHAPSCSPGSPPRPSLAASDRCTSPSTAAGCPARSLLGREGGGAMGAREQGALLLRTGWRVLHCWEGAAGPEAAQLPVSEPRRWARASKAHLRAPGASGAASRTSRRGLVPCSLRSRARASLAGACAFPRGLVRRWRRVQFTKVLIQRSGACKPSAWGCPMATNDGAGCCSLPQGCSRAHACTPATVAVSILHASARRQSHGAERFAGSFSRQAQAAWALSGRWRRV